MDPALKQRLLGAAVLLALLVIFVPMLFPGPAPRDQAESVNLDIPAEPDSALSSRVFELGIPEQGEAQHATGPAAAATVPTRAQVQPPAPDKTPQFTLPPQQQATASAAETGSGPGTAAATRFAVSVGVFGDAGNADSRLARVKLLGYPAYVAKVDVDGKPAHGVRVGPFDGRADAEAARLRLKQQLRDARPALVALGSSLDADAPGTSISPDEAGSWAVQLAAFRARTDADALRDQLRKAGFEAFVDDTLDADGTWWRVRVGPRTDRADAEALQKAIKDKLGKDGLVVTQP